MGCHCHDHTHGHKHDHENEKKTWKDYIPIVVLAGILITAAYCQQRGGRVQEEMQKKPDTINNAAAYLSQTNSPYTYSIADTNSERQVESELIEKIGEKQ